MSFGIKTGSPYIVIPPRQTEFSVYAVCSAKCTTMMDRGGYMVHSAFGRMRNRGNL